MSLLDEIEAQIPALRRHARALTRDASRADDLVQDCLERAVAARDRFRGPEAGGGSLRGWLFRILTNLHRDALRRDSLRSHLVVAGDLPEPARPGGQEAHLALREVEAALTRLPEDQRRALLLVAVEGLSLAEAAQALDIAEGTLVSRLGRARASLRAMTGREPRRERKAER
ncbi:sigma-70 family RNA polymerase sigma factor [Frigidibacter oleivorans]|uniref:sigma-70 family RNA polymerase sigma factor n=1 Tax=Frigidibacter oleivorans TaxID=2487129 RepID=UPI000F8DC1F9|nr:sigma-70 family RNA polymerase sigma factor [Frigidibacter oleivorans]